ncbi:MAG: menaquinone biosynthesis protein [Pirellulales bacterium]|nr:menaquinone biosynthesis protein [Pirellulales bacterium]
MSNSASNEPSAVRIGAVTYLNARPLTFCLPQYLPGAQVTVDLPSRLADALAAGRLDVALVPSIECFRHADYAIVSDACVACDGPVRSVMLYGRVPVEQVRTLALDEGSRTSAAMAQILLKERFDLQPRLRLLPIGASIEDSDADAVMLIGDRALRPTNKRYAFIWDLGEQWSRWAGLPFVFAMWIARCDRSGPPIYWPRLGQALGAARDEGTDRLAEIARRAAPAVGIPEAACLTYLRDHLDFRLGDRQRRGLGRFRELAVRHGHASAGVELVFDDQPTAR